MAVKVPNVRHLRRRNKIRHSKRLLAFIAEQNARLTATAKAVGVLTAASNAADTKTVTIGARTYTFQGTLTNVNGNVKIGASLTASLTNLKNAINGSGGTPGTDYAAATVAHTLVDATGSTATTLSVRAKTGGAAGNLALSTNVATASWDHATMTGGEDVDTLDLLTRNEARTIAAAATRSDLA